MELEGRLTLHRWSHVGRLVGGQLQDPVGHLLGLTESAQRDSRRPGVMPLGAARLAAVTGVATGPGWTELHSMPSLAYWMDVTW